MDRSACRTADPSRCVRPVSKRPALQLSEYRSCFLKSVHADRPFRAGLRSGRPQWWESLRPACSPPNPPVHGKAAVDRWKSKRSKLHEFPAILIDISRRDLTITLLGRIAIALRGRIARPILAPAVSEDEVATQGLAGIADIAGDADAMAADAHRCRRRVQDAAVVPRHERAPAMWSGGAERLVLEYGQAYRHRPIVLMQKLTNQLSSTGWL